MIVCKDIYALLDVICLVAEAYARKILNSLSVVIPHSSSVLNISLACTVHFGLAKQFWFAIHVCEDNEVRRFLPSRAVPFRLPSVAVISSPLRHSVQAGAPVTNLCEAL